MCNVNVNVCVLVCAHSSLYREEKIKTSKERHCETNDQKNYEQKRFNFVRASESVPEKINWKSEIQQQCCVIRFAFFLFLSRSLSISLLLTRLSAWRFEFIQSLFDPNYSELCSVWMCAFITLLLWPTIYYRMHGWSISMEFFFTLHSFFLPAELEQKKKSFSPFSLFLARLFFAHLFCTFSSAIAIKHKRRTTK